MKVQKINFSGRTWTAHAQDHWLDFAGNPNFPDYLRIVFVAYGRHAANGHARLGQGELARFLVRKEGTLPDRRNVRHSIDRAVALGYLAPGSKTLCLIVSARHVQGGSGDPETVCTRDHTVRTTQKDVSRVRRFPQKDVAETGPFEEKDVPGQRRFVLGPSISLVPDHNAPEVSA